MYFGVSKSICEPLFERPRSSEICKISKSVAYKPKELWETAVPFLRGLKLRKKE